MNKGKRTEKAVMNGLPVLGSAIGHAWVRHCGANVGVTLAVSPACCPLRCRPQAPALYLHDMRKVS